MPVCSRGLCKNADSNIVKYSKLKISLKFISHCVSQLFIIVADRISEIKNRKEEGFILLLVSEVSDCGHVALLLLGLYVVRQNITLGRM